MKPLFFFGTLRHPALLQAVLGDVAHIELTPAILPGYAIKAAAEGPFPMILPIEDGEGAGLLAEGITDADLARLDYYESAFGYDLVDVTLQDGRAARTYMPQENLWTPQGPWSLDNWARDWGAISVIAAQEVMSYMGQKSPGEIATMFPMIRARAWSQVNAAQSRHSADMLHGRIDMAERTRKYARYFAVDELRLRHERFDGTMSEKMLRAVFIAADAALVLPYDPVRDRVLLIEQMRVGPLARGDTSLWHLEPIAGRLDPGEPAQAAARREAVEEAGVELGALHEVAECYCSPGNSTEFYYIYVGLADLPDDITGVGGLADEDEDIRSHLMDFDELMRLCDNQLIANAPLVLMAYWLARHRAGLRAAS
ncbi:NUDIX domain-containing protein [uncultured Roseobacter sp.]|uniref:NUDIX domain-containing protein n=1 Tax=uncultured Roseobacter sp. TaxID=114847 RepID=UPI0026308B15|nr:NUDIX domain-containing protein [uncultured Roseobacter sp.]